MFFILVKYTPIDICPWVRFINFRLNWKMQGPFICWYLSCICALYVLLLYPASPCLLHVIFILGLVILIPTCGPIWDLFLSFLGLLACFFFTNGANGFFSNSGQSSDLTLDESWDCMLLGMSPSCSIHLKMACTWEIPFNYHFLHAHSFLTKFVLHLKPSVLWTSIVLLLA